MEESPIFAEPLVVDNVEECAFYHTMDIPDVGTVEGFFDLRGTVDEYLGHVSFRDKRVLEIGPASGFLTFQMEKRGAEVVAVDVSESFNWDTVPYSAEILDSWGKERWSHMDQLRKGFWFAHRRLQSRAKVHYGSSEQVLPHRLRTSTMEISMTVASC